MGNLLGFFLGSPPPEHSPPSLNKKVVVISDTHGFHRSLPPLPAGDILIHAGDFTRFGDEDDLKDFNIWLGEQRSLFSHIVVVEGNHEAGTPWKSRTAELLSHANFLRNESIVCDGVKIHGKGFFWNMKTPNPYDELIPADTDILIAHNPARGYLDGGHGCESSLQMVSRLNPRLYVCGHVHTARGVIQGTGYCGTTVFVNGANVLGDHKAKSAAEATYQIQGGALEVTI